MELNVDSFFIFNESLITRARNYLVDEFLRAEEFTHLMFIDSDINFNPKDVLSLAVLCDDESQLLLVVHTVKNVLHGKKFVRS